MSSSGEQTEAAAAATSANSSVDSGMPSQQQQQQQQPDHHTALYTRLRSQVEFYFSPQNLGRDTYLRNMLTAKHQEIPSPPPLQLMTPIGVITNFPKVRDICASFGAAGGPLPQPPHVLLARACEESAVVTISADRAWIGPTSQVLPPLTGGAAAGVPMVPQSLQIYQQGITMPPSYHQQHASPHPSPHGQRMMMVPVSIQGEIQPMPHGGVGGGPPMHVKNPISHESESPSSNSLESMTKDVVVSVMDMPMECNPIQMLSAFTTDTVRPKGVSVEEGHNNIIWYVTFATEEDAKAAIAASSEKTISGIPIKAKLKSELPVSVASASVASLSSMSEGQRPPMPMPGAPPQMLQQPMPVMGAYPGMPPQPSPPPPVQPGMPPYPPVGPQYAMPPMPVGGMPPGQPYPPPYYNPQQQMQMQQLYSYYAMQQQGQPFPPQYPMGGRYSHGGIPPPPPRYPGPAPYPYQGMSQQYHNMGEHGYYHGHPPRQHHGMNDRRGSAGHGDGFHDGNHNRFEHGGKQKKKNRRNSIGHDQEGGRHHGHHSYNGDQASSPSNFGGKGKARRGEHVDYFRRSTGSASPTFNKHQRKNSNRLSSSSTSPSKGNGEAGDAGNKEIFTASDFPGLGGDAKPSDKHEGASKDEANKLFGYADALLKKQACKDKEAAPVETAVTVDKVETEADRISRQTEAMEREILSEFHDLSIVEDNKADDKTESHTVGTSSTSTNDATSLPSNDEPPKHLPILPGPFLDSYEMSESYSSDPSPKPVSDAAQKEPVHKIESSASPSQPESTSTPADKQVKAPNAWGSKRLFSDVSVTTKPPL